MGENRVTMSLIKRYVSVMLVAALVLTGIQLPTMVSAKEKTQATKLTLTVGETTTLTADVPMVEVTKTTPENPVTGETPEVITAEEPAELTWTSSETKVATVSETGTVKALTVGETTITLYANGEVYKVWEVTVRDTAKPTVTPDKPTVTPDDPTEAPDDPTEAPDDPTEAPDDPTEAPDDPTGKPTVTPEEPTGEATPTPVVTGTVTVTVTPKPTATIVPSKAPVNTATPAPSYKKVSSVKLDAKKVTVGTKATFKLTATVNPSDAKIKDVTWSSSNKKVATVDSKGKVKALKVGKAVITVTTKDGNKSAKCTVTVKQGVKVSYKLAGGKNNPLNPTYVAKGVKTKLAAPTRKGYTFKGWYVNNKKVTSVKATKAITVTAKWEKVKVGAVTLKSAKASKNTIKVTIAKKVKGVDGYTVSYSTDKKVKKNVQTATIKAKKTSTTIKNLKKGTYYVKVAAYKTDSAGKKVNGKASKILKVTIK